jgi:hypothetical protein
MTIADTIAKQRSEGHAMKLHPADPRASENRAKAIAREMSRFIGKRVGDEAEAAAFAACLAYLEANPEAELVKIPGSDAKGRQPGDDDSQAIYDADGALVVRVRAALINAEDPE